jgi:organic radical activating enzyme
MEQETIVEWEVTLDCNFNCFYCCSTKLVTRTPEQQAIITGDFVIRNFIKSLGEKYPGVEIFLFGGEPFLHPKIDYIIKCFNDLNIPFVIQSNFSKKSVKVIKTIQQPFKLNVSIHPTEVKFEHLEYLFSTQATFGIVDVMYTGKDALKYYLKIKSLLPNADNLYLTPISDFGDGVSNDALAEFNTIRHDPNYQKFIQFENIERYGRLRSELWADPEFVVKGKPCLYNGKFFLYGPNLDLYNCCHRVQHDGICPKDKCFLM